MSAPAITNPHLYISQPLNRHANDLGFSADDQNKLGAAFPSAEHTQPQALYYSPMTQPHMTSASETQDRATQDFSYHTRLGMPAWTQETWRSAGGENSRTAQFLHNLFYDYMQESPTFHGAEHIRDFFEKNPEGVLVLGYGPHTFETLDISSLAACITRATEKLPVTSIAPAVRAMFGDSVAKKLGIHNVDRKTLSRDLNPSTKHNQGRILVMEPAGTREANTTTLKGINKKVRFDALQKAGIVSLIAQLAAEYPDKTIGMAYIVAPYNSKIELEDRRWYSDSLARKNMPSFPISWSDIFELSSRSDKTQLPLTFFCSQVKTVTAETKASDIFDTEFKTFIGQTEQATKTLLEDTQNFSSWLDQPGNSHKARLEQLENLLQQHETTCLTAQRELLTAIADYAKTNESLAKVERTELEDLQKLLLGRHTSEVLSNHLGKHPAENKIIKNSLHAYIAQLKKREFIAGLINDTVRQAERDYIEHNPTAFTEFTSSHAPKKEQFIINQQWVVEEHTLTMHEKHLGLGPRLIAACTAGMRHNMEVAYEAVTSYLPWTAKKPDPLQATPENITATQLYEPPAGLQQIKNQATLAERQLKIIEAVKADRAARSALNTTGVLAAWTLPEALILFGLSAQFPALSWIGPTLWTQSGLREAYLEWQKNEHSFTVTHGVFATQAMSALLGPAGGLVGSAITLVKLANEWGIGKTTESMYDPNSDDFLGHLSL